jgi:hypothetical protein
MIVLEIENSLKESSTAKWSFSSSSGGQSHPTQSLEHLRMLRKEPSMTIFWCNFKPMILLIVTIVILEGYITRALSNLKLLLNMVPPLVGFHCSLFMPPIGVFTKLWVLSVGRMLVLSFCTSPSLWDGCFVL